ncbi:replication initiation protein RepM, partial [Klebsiella pneumoniae]|uniref:replication initiation protein RepM n=1 Tax=Klebsiella pneumoniae TaxID=573 RepID=UPI003FA04724
IMCFNIHKNNGVLMKGGLVVKDNALMNASYNLEVTEQRLILLAIISARETGKGITADSKLEIHASDYAKQFNVTKEGAYKALKEAVNNLFDRQFSFQEETSKGIGIVRSRWVSRIKYIDDSALLEITFAPDVVPLITRLEKHFTSYQINQVSGLTGKYAIRLYELLITWREVGKTPILKLGDFRSQLGVEPNEYKAMNHFKSRVLEPSLQQINEKTDIKVKVEQHKNGRSISGFSFRFKQKPQPKVEQKTDPKRDPNTPDFFVEMTDAQRHLFAHKLSELPEVGSEYAEIGESSEDFTKRLADMLLEPKKFRMFYPLLEQLGFGSKKIQSAPIKQVDEPKFIELRNMQVNSLSFNMSRDKKFAHLKQENESPDDFMQRLRIMLKDPKQQIQFYDYVNAKK